MKIIEAIDMYLDSVKLARSAHTHSAYETAMKNFQMSLLSHNVDSQEMDVASIKENCISWFATDLKVYAPSTEQLYITAAKGFLEYLVAENLSNVNLSKIKLLIQQRTRKPGKRLPQFPADAIRTIIDKLEEQKFIDEQNESNKLRALRDKSFLITLADTGLRVHEACALRRGDIDWNEGKALVIGKGNRQAVVRFSKRVQKYLRDYLQMRARIDGNSGRPLRSLALFARHDKGAGKKIKPISPATGRKIVHLRVKELLGDDYVGTITPHSFRHFFVTKVLTVTGNLKLAQNLARHKNIAVTQRYAHLSNDELDKGYWEVFETD